MIKTSVDKYAEALRWIDLTGLSLFPLIDGMNPDGPEFAAGRDDPKEATADASSAFALFLEAYNLDKSNVGATVGAACLLFDSGQVEDALRLFVDAHNNNPGDDRLICGLELIGQAFAADQTIGYFEALLGNDPSNHKYHGAVARLADRVGDKARLRDVIQRAQRESEPCLDYQAHKQPTVERPRGNDVLGPRALPGEAEQGQVDATPASVELAEHSPIGMDMATIAARIGGTRLPTNWFVEYGASPDTLKHATEPAFVPPGIGRLTKESISLAPESWSVYSADWSFIDGAGDDDDLNRPLPFLRLHTPFGKDRNHMAGIGVIDLIGGWQGRAEPEPAGHDARTGGRIDLRDAVLELDVRAGGLDLKDFRFCCFCQNQLEDRTIFYMVDGTCWALTGQTVGSEVLATDDWVRLTFTFVDDPGEWSFMANNPAEQHFRAGRYSYQPLGRMLSGHKGNFAFGFIYGDERDTPDGHLDIRAVSLRYRDWSVLAPGAGATLTEWPKESPSEPSHLTEGTFGLEDRCWASSEDSSAPQIFEWTFRQPCTVTAIKLHQHPLWPTDRVEIAAIREGGSREMIASLSFGENEMRLYHELDDDIGCADIECSGLCVTLVGPAGAGVWGLDALEVFSSNLEPIPSTELTTLSQELVALPPGGRIYYRVVAENEAGRTATDVCALDMPSGQSPLLHDVRMSDEISGRKLLRVRANAMGLPSVMTTECLTAAMAEIIDRTDIGEQNTAREHVVPIRDVEFDAVVSIRVTVTNAEGEFSRTLAKSDLATAPP